MSGEYSELDDFVDMARETIAATRDDQARIRAMDHDQHVSWGYPDEEDWRARA